MCGPDGLQAHGFGLGLAMGHDTKSVRCVLSWSLRFFVPAVPQRRCPRQSVLMRVDAYLDPCNGYSWPQGSALMMMMMSFICSCTTAQYTNAFSSGVCVVKCLDLVILNDVVEKRTCMSLFWGLAQLWMLESYCGAAQ